MQDVFDSSSYYFRSFRTEQPSRESSKSTVMLTPRIELREWTSQTSEYKAFSQLQTSWNEMDNYEKLHSSLLKAQGINEDI